jgi:hypothetical protein
MSLACLLGHRYHPRPSGVRYSCTRCPAWLLIWGPS